MNVVGYQLKERENRKAPKPEWPDSIVDEKTVIKNIRSHLKMGLTIVFLYPSMYEMKGSEQEYRLVYEPIPDRPWIDAVTGLDIFELEHYVMPPSFPPPMSTVPVPKPTYDETLSWEQFLGINLEHYILEKSEDDGERIKYFYKPGEWEEKNPEPEVLTVDAYMERKWGDKLRFIMESTIVVQLEKKTGHLVAFHRIGSYTDELPTLSREQCWRKAEQFMWKVFPDYAHYLQLEIDKEKTEGELREREFFYLPIYINGIPVNHERVTVSVNTSTGDICTYMGVSYEMIQELSGRNFLPNITPEVAFDRYVQQRVNLYGKSRSLC